MSARGPWRGLVNKTVFFAYLRGVLLVVDLMRRNAALSAFVYLDWPWVRVSELDALLRAHSYTFLLRTIPKKLPPGQEMSTTNSTCFALSD